MKISAAIKEYLLEIEVRKYTPKTIRGYRNSLNLFLLKAAKLCLFLRKCLTIYIYIS